MSIKNLLRQSANNLLFIAPFTVIVLVGINGYFQQPALDDFVINWYVKSMGLPSAIKYFFLHDGARYITAPLLFLLCSSKFLLQHYFLFSWSLLIIVFYSIYYFLRQYLCTIQGSCIDPKRTYWVTAIVLLVILFSIQDLPDFFFWAPASFTYLLSVPFFLRYLISFMKIINGNAVSRKEYGKLFFYTFLLCGCNEITAYTSTLVPLLYFCYCLFFLRKINYELGILVLTGMLCSSFLLFLPGNEHRVWRAIPQSVWYSLASASYQFVEMLCSIFSNPLFCVVFIYFFGATLIQSANRRDTYFFIQKLFLLFFFNWLFYFLIRHVSGWVMPDRGNNLVITLDILIILFMGDVRSIRIESSRFFAASPLVRFLVGSIICVNFFTVSLIENIMADYYHWRVLSERVAIMTNAKAAGKKIAVIPAYKDEIKTVLENSNNVKWAHFLSKKFSFPPKTIFFSDDPWNIVSGPYYAEFYDIDTIQVGDRKIIREGLFK